MDVLPRFGDRSSATLTHGPVTRFIHVDDVVPKPSQLRVRRPCVVPNLAGWPIASTAISPRDRHPTATPINGTRPKDVPRPPQLTTTAN
ncbi:hypothetical protein PGTUg99_009300 [Puccinia graminis f. sp. tritici]|uniref:Uncharacterized protein n=1 Tax=Puccinia graminis f. sp. tritici TaxID=56615 RepID=A0A5B0RG82_PUCGR|nr:hypothetical protein PGTUg99_009300 [Puccinia graminis f. sp. tritici]